VAAAVQAEILPGDANPLEVLRRREHLLDELAVLVLVPLPLHQSPLRLPDPVGESVPNSLQLAQVEHPRRRGEGIDPVRDLGAAEAVAEAGGELGLEPGDLPPQLQARLALVDPDFQPVESWLSQQSGHLQKV
jgi:hypothetical protein